MTITQCVECGSLKEHYDPFRGEIICGKCGLVKEERMIDPDREWRVFDTETKNRRERTGPPTSFRYPDKTTVISDKIKGTSTMEGQKILRLRKFDRRMKKEKNNTPGIEYMNGEINRMSSQLGLPDSYKERASLIIRNYYDKMDRGHMEYDFLVPSAIYIACRQLESPRTASEIALVSKIGGKTLEERKRKMLREEKRLCNKLNIKLPPLEPTRLLSRFANKLGFSDEELETARLIAKKTATLGLYSGKGPEGVAGGILYITGKMYGKKDVTEKSVANATLTTPVTIRHRYEEIVNALDLTIDNNKIYDNFYEKVAEET